MEVTEQPGPVGDEEEEEDDDAGSVTSNSTTDSNAVGAAGSGKKKKSKKKKKKKGDGNGADGTAGEASASGSVASSSNSPNSVNSNAGGKPRVDKGEADKRFNAALEGARKGDLWVDLSSTAMQTSKAKKLFDSLKGCDGVTSVDLSGNNISDEGAQSIASILGMNGLPALIELDLRDNPLTPDGLRALEGLHKLRKKLFVKTGSSKAPEPEPSAPKSGSKELKDVSKGKMFRKFFQTGDDDDDESHQESMLDDRGVNPAELWEEIESKQRDGPLTALAAKLQQLCGLLQREVQAIQSASSNALDGSKPHVKECVANLGVFADCLGMQPRRLILQCSTEPLPAVGSHRVAVAEAVALLVSPNNLSLDRAVLGSNLVPQVIKLALQQPLCSLLHVRALHLLRSCLSSSVPELAVSLLQPGWGVELPAWRVASGGRASVAPSADEDQEDAPEGPCGPLPEVIAETATSAVSVPSGSRSPNMGFVLEVCKVLKAACSAPEDGKERNEAVASALEGNDAWAKFSGDGGALSTLLTEQGGDLCGPRPVRPPMDVAAELGEVEGSGGAPGHMTGREILAFLQSMTAMGVIS